MAKRASGEKRLSTISGSCLPEVVPTDISQGKEVVHTDPQSEKVYPPPENYPEPFDEEGGKEVVPLSVDPAPYQQPHPMTVRMNTRVCGIRLKWTLVVLLLVLIAIALGGGLGAGLSTGSK